MRNQGENLGKFEAKADGAIFIGYAIAGNDYRVYNHLVREVVLDRENDKLNCWTQSKRVFQNLLRINKNSGVELAYHPFVQVYISTLSSSISPNSLSSMAMKGVIQHPPAQATKPSKTKSKLTTSSVSQKAGVVKSTKTKNVGSVKVISKGEGTGANKPL